MKLRLRLAHFALHEIDNPFRFRHGIILGERADDYTRAIEKDDRRRDALALGIRDDLRLAVRIDVRDSAEGGAKVNSNCFSSSHICGYVRDDSAPWTGAIFMPEPNANWS